MFFLDDFLGELLVYLPTNVEPIDTVTLTGGEFDFLYVTNATQRVYPHPLTPPNDWDQDTILSAKFDNTTNAGNTIWTTENTKALLVRRRKKNPYDGNNKWITIFSQDIKKPRDFSINRIDPLNRGNTHYEYAAIPVNKDGIEGEPIIVDVFSNFDPSIFIMTKDRFWGSFVSDGAINTSRNVSKTYQSVIHRRYPISVSNATVNYDTGSVTAQWYPWDAETCSLVFDDDSRVWYEQQFMDFLTDYTPKILKHFDGRMWMIEVNSSPTDSMVQHYNIRQVTFNWTEIGNCELEYDLYRANLIDVEPEYWVSPNNGWTY